MVFGVGDTTYAYLFILFSIYLQRHMLQWLCLSSPILSLIHHRFFCWFGLVWFGFVWFRLLVGLFVWYPPGALHFPVAATGNGAVTPRPVAVRVLGLLSVGSACWKDMKGRGLVGGFKGVTVDFFGRTRVTRFTQIDASFLQFLHQCFKSWQLKKFPNNLCDIWHVAVR